MNERVAGSAVDRERDYVASIPNGPDLTIFARFRPTALFEDLQKRKINLVSIKDGVDLSTAAGRLMANVLASVAAYENEVKGERIRAGQAQARANGKRWGGSKKGKRRKVTARHEKLIKRMKDEGEPVMVIAKTLGLSRPTIYDVLAMT